MLQNKIGYLCDKAKSVNKDGKIIHGCGCRLDAKARLFDEKCILNNGNDYEKFSKR